MKKLVFLLALIPSLTFAQCDNFANSKWIAKTQNSIHQFEFYKQDVKINTISKEDSYFHGDTVNATAFRTKSSYYRNECEVVFELPHENLTSHQVYGYFGNDKGYAYYMNDGKPVVMEFVKN